MFRKWNMPAALFIGVAVRLWIYFLDSSFWRDESKLLINIAQNSFLDLLHPLNYGQQGPIPYLWCLRVLWLLGAPGELAMRGISLAASLLGFYIFYLLVSYFLSDRRARFFSVTLFAFSPSIILFAGISKQYAIDILVAVLLLHLLRHWFLPSGSDDRNMHITEYVFVALSPWLSFQAIFIIMALGGGALFKGRRKNLPEALICLTTGGISFLLQWMLILRQWASQRLHGLDNILFFRHDLFGGWIWDLRQIYFCFTGPNLTLFLIVGSVFATILLFMGVRESRRRHGWSCVMAFMLPLFFAIAASSIKLYPMVGRYLIFSAPGIFLLIGYGLDRLFISSSRPWLKYSAVLVLLILPCLTEDLRTFRKQSGGVREALQFIADRWHEDDLVLCDPGAASSIEYYRLLKKESIHDLKFVLEPGKCIEESPAAVDIPTEFSRLSNDFSLANHRIWLVSETMYYPYQRSDTQAFKEQFVAFLNRFIGKKKIKGPVYYEESVHLGWENITAKLFAERRLEYGYHTNQVRVYGFGKQ
jgi:hypothetical protein